MDLGLHDRTYIVTGGSRGLGRATVDVLVAEGARVVVSGRSPDAILEVTDHHGDDRVVGVTADNRDPETARRLVAEAQQRFGRLDGALVSVGGPPGGPLAGIDDDQWRDAFESVFLGALRVAETVADSVDPGVDGDASIALVLSTTVREPQAGLAISNGLRPGLAMVAKDLANRLGPRLVRVNGLLPGRIDTDRMRELTSGADDPESARREVESQIPLGRYGQPAEFGRVAAFVLSPAASYLTGSMVTVDGGVSHTI